MWPSRRDRANRETKHFDNRWLLKLDISFIISMRCTQFTFNYEKELLAKHSSTSYYRHPHVDRSSRATCTLNCTYTKTQTNHANSDLPTFELLMFPPAWIETIQYNDEDRYTWRTLSSKFRCARLGYNYVWFVSTLMTENSPIQTNDAI